MKSKTLAVWLMVFGGVCQALTISDGLTTDIDKTIYEDIIIYNNFWNEPTTVNLKAGGYITQSHVYDDSQLNILDGRIDGYVYSYNNSRVNVSGGTLYRMYLYENSFAAISGGVISSFIEIGGSVTGGYGARGGGILHLSGGEVTGNILALDDCEVLVNGGVIGGALKDAINHDMFEIGEDLKMERGRASGANLGMSILNDLGDWSERDGEVDMWF